MSKTPQEMNTTLNFSSDQPELRLFAQLAGIAPSKLAAAFNEPELLFKHITPDQLASLKEASFSLSALSNRLAASCDIYLKYAKGVLEASA